MLLNIFGTMKDVKINKMTSQYHFEESKPRIVVEFSFWELNGKRVSTSRKKFNCFTNDSLRFKCSVKNYKVRVVRTVFMKIRNIIPSFFYMNVYR